MFMCESMHRLAHLSHLLASPLAWTGKSSGELKTTQGDVPFGRLERYDTVVQLYCEAATPATSGYRHDRVHLLSIRLTTATVSDSQAAVCALQLDPGRSLKKANSQ